MREVVMKVRWFACFLGILGCGEVNPEDLDAQHSALSVPIFAILRFENQDVRLYRGPYATTFSNNDWSPGYTKAECGFVSGSGDLGWMMGLALHKERRCGGGFYNDCFDFVWNTTAICSDLPAFILQRAKGVRISVANGDHRLDTTLGDWAYGYRKAECGKTQVLTGWSQGGAGICTPMSTGGLGPAACNVRWFVDSDSRGMPDRGDWSPNNFKGECGPGEYIKGVATTSQVAVALLCCSPPVLN
jgi:hypothetical protein